MRAALRVPIYVANEAIELELGIFKILTSCTTSIICSNELKLIRITLLDIVTIQEI